MAPLPQSASLGNNLEFHPLANLFPLLEGEDFDALVADIKAHALRTLITLHEGKILDGRNRYRAMLAAGHTPNDGHFYKYESLHPDDTPLDYVIRANLHRRHLTAEQKRDLIAKLLKAKPESSNRQIATQVKVDHKTVGSRRSEMEGRGEIPHVEARTDTKGRAQPAHREKIRCARTAEAITRKHAAEMRKKREDYHEYMDEKISRFARELIQLDARLARELGEIIAEGGDPHQLMNDLEDGLRTNNNDDGLAIPDYLKRAAP